MVEKFIPKVLKALQFSLVEICVLMYAQKRAEILQLSVLISKPLEVHKYESTIIMQG